VIGEQVQVSASIAEKAVRLLEQRRVLVVTDGHAALVCDQALVGGDCDLYRVTATVDAIRCDCPAGQVGAVCSHAVAAMVAWAEAAE
jgi:uncharacterized Zn finger protein